MSTEAARGILVIEDSDEDFEATLRAFRKNGITHPVRRCTDGEEALDYVFEGDPPRPALILLDLNLPGTDGREVLEAIKAREETRSIPVVVLSTSSNPRDVLACYRTGASGYLIKPVDFGRFVDSIRSLKDYWFHAVTLPDGEV